MRSSSGSIESILERVTRTGRLRLADMRKAAAALGLFFFACTTESQSSPATSPTPAVEVPAAAVPPRLVGASIAYDPARNELGVFGAGYASTEVSTRLALPASPTAQTRTLRAGTLPK